MIDPDLNPRREDTVGLIDTASCPNSCTTPEPTAAAGRTSPTPWKPAPTTHECDSILPRPSRIALVPGQLTQTPA
jgi:hypothetical protein